jgi:hypothetical protein
LFLVATNIIFAALAMILMPQQPPAYLYGFVEINNMNTFFSAKMQGNILGFHFFFLSQVNSCYKAAIVKSIVSLCY